MMKRFCISLLLGLLCIFSSRAEEVAKENAMTNRWSLISGTAVAADQYMTNQEYSGDFSGLGWELGRFYKKKENLSWNLDMTFISSPYFKALDMHGLVNPAGSTSLAIYNLWAEYGTFYNWNPVTNLYITAGGSLDLRFGLNNGKPNSINNQIDLDLQTQFKAAAGIKYGWTFKKWGISLRGDFAVPFIGMFLCGTQFESSMDSLIDSKILNSNNNPFRLSSFHNLQGFNYELAVDFEFQNCTIFITTGANNRWWTAGGINNYRKFEISKIGLSLDLISRSRINSRNRYF